MKQNSTITVKHFNNFTFNGGGKKVIAVKYQVQNIAEAMNKAFIQAVRWNKTECRNNMKITQLICEGYYRNI